MGNPQQGNDRQQLSVVEAWQPCSHQGRIQGQKRSRSIHRLAHKQDAFLDGGFSPLPLIAQPAATLNPAIVRISRCYLKKYWLSLAIHGIVIFFTSP